MQAWRAQNRPTVWVRGSAVAEGADVHLGHFGALHGPHVRDREADSGGSVLPPARPPEMGNADPEFLSKTMPFWAIRRASRPRVLSGKGGPQGRRSATSTRVTSSSESKSDEEEAMANNGMDVTAFVVKLRKEDDTDILRQGVKILAMFRSRAVETISIGRAHDR